MEFIGILILASFVFLYMIKNKPGKNINQISTADLKGQLGDRSTQFIDVRTPGEYKNNHIKGFRNIPLQSLQKGSQALDKNKKVIVICQSGMRSARASKMLTNSGFTSVTNVKGGMSSWSN